MQAEKGARLLADDILKEAKEKAANVIRGAKQQAASIIDGARISAQEEEKRKLAEARIRGRQVYEEILAQAKMRVKKEILRKKESLIKDIFREAEEKLRKHALSREYKDDLIRIAVNACRKLVSKDMVIRANQRDLKILESSKETIERELSGNKENVNISFGEPIQTMGGVRVGTLDGKVEVDETFEGIMQRKFDELRVKAAKLLFEGS